MKKIFVERIANSFNNIDAICMPTCLILLLLTI
jgi:hypothetical protein